MESCPPCSINLMVPAAIACARRGARPPGAGEGDVAAAGLFLNAAVDALEQLGQRLDAAGCRRDLNGLATTGKV
jgi:hypothetical protein